MRNFTMYLFGTVLLILAISQESYATQTQTPDGQPKPAHSVRTPKTKEGTGTNNGQKVGAVGQQSKPTFHVKQVVKSVRSQILKQAGEKLKESDPPKTLSPKATITVVSFASQVVRGTNYNVKLNVGGNIFHAKIHEPLKIKGQTKEQQANQLLNLVGPKQQSDPVGNL